MKVTKLTVAAMARESGFYWLRKGAGTAWRIAEWNAPSGCWYVTGWEARFYDSEFAEIDESRVVRDVSGRPLVA